MELLPWHQAQWRNLEQRFRNKALPHALLLCGPAGLGKLQFSAYLVQTLLCENGIVLGKPCGQCRSCELFAAHNHPDLRLVSPLEEAKVIAVDQIREVARYLSQTSQYGGYKAVIISPADRMNINAANSLLKTLEEPSSRSLLMLISDLPGRLPATILSRCQRIAFTIPERDQAEQWLSGRIPAEQDLKLLLDLAEGAPLRALELGESDALNERANIIQDLEALARGAANPSAMAERFLKVGTQQTLFWMYNWLADLIRLRSGGTVQAIANHDMSPVLMQLAQHIDVRKLHEFMGRLNEALRLSGGQINPQLLMENLLMDWQETFLSKRRRTG